MKWPLALIALFGFGLEAKAQSPPPLTLDGLFAIAPQEAAKRVFGPTPEMFVERSPWNSLQPNYILGTINQFQMEFFTRPERIAPAVCAVTLGYAVFDTGPPKDLSADDRTAWGKLGYSQRPLRLLAWKRRQQYFAAAPAPATPAEPDGKPITPNREALAADSCENPVVLRGRFEAPSAEAAVLLVTKAEAAVAAANSRKRLPFRLEETCYGPNECRPRRRLLGSLQVGRIRDARFEDCADWQNVKLPKGAAQCLSFLVDDPSLPPGRYWDFTLMLDRGGKLREVWMATSEDAIIP